MNRIKYTSDAQMTEVKKLDGMQSLNKPRQGENNTLLKFNKTGVSKMRIEARARHWCGSPWLVSSVATVRLTLSIKTRLLPQLPHKVRILKLV
jgi:hypothetical protein